MSADNPVLEDFTLDNYLKAHHIWVNKTGIGVGVGMNPQDNQRWGRVDEALTKLDKKRRISVFAPGITRWHDCWQNQEGFNCGAAKESCGIGLDNPRLAVRSPFDIPFNLKWPAVLVAAESGASTSHRLIVDGAEIALSKILL